MICERAFSFQFLLTDQVGTLRAVADTSGNIVKRIDYDSFGNIISDSNPGFSMPFGFAGGLHDRDTGLVRFGYRDYSPELGRFVAKDPIDFAGGDTNLYAYVTNDPVNMADPFGLKPGDKFPTRDAAAIDALDYVIGRSTKENLEYGGFVYRNGDKSYSYTEAVPGAKNGMDISTFKKPCGGEPLEAIYHTHPGYKYNVGWFSTDDYMTSSGNKLPIYLGTSSGTIRSWSDVESDRTIR